MSIIESDAEQAYQQQANRLQQLHLETQASRIGQVFTPFHPPIDIEEMQGDVRALRKRLRKQALNDRKLWGVYKSSLEVMYEDYKIFSVMDFFVLLPEVLKSGRENHNYFLPPSIRDDKVKPSELESFSREMRMLLSSI